MLFSLRFQSPGTKMSYLKNVTFIKSVFSLQDLPKEKKPQFCIVGRSNVGKSSLINALTNNKNMAKTSKTAGCTRSLNFFEIEKKCFMVDLPGYGYAKAPKSEKYGWNNLILEYLKTCRDLKRVFILIDSRHWLKPIDIELMQFLDEIGQIYQLILTKTDKIKNSELQECCEQFDLIKDKFPALYPALLHSSSAKKDGIGQIVSAIFDLISDK